MMEADLLVKDCRVVKPDVVVDCGLAIRDGSIAAVLRQGETVPARRTIDAGGRFVIPGLARELEESPPFRCKTVEELAALP